MAIIINSLEAKRLRDISSVEEMLTPDYLSNTKHIQTAFIYEKFFDGADQVKRKQRLELLNISYSIPSLVSEIFSDFIGMPSTSLELDIDQWLNSFTWGGLSVFKLKIVNGEFEVEWQSPDGYIKDDDGTERLYNWYIELDQKGDYNRYIFEQVYRPGTIKNKLWKIAGQTNKSGVYFRMKNSEEDASSKYLPFEGEQVPLSTMEATRFFPDFENTNLDVNPIVVVHNTKRGITKYGSSDVIQIRSMISSIEVELVNLQDQLLKHLQAKLHIPISKAPVDKDGFIDLSKLEVILMEQGDPNPGYIMNTNPLIDQTFVLIEKLIVQISAVLRIPVEFFGIQTVKGVESDSTKTKRSAAFIKRIEKAQRKFGTALFQINEIREKLGFEKDPDFSVVWPNSFPVDKKEQVDELATAIDAQLVSRRKAIMKYQDLETEEEVEVELQAINNEQSSIQAEALPL